jgi:putative hydrolase of the HAD superfamily
MKEHGLKVLLLDIGGVLLTNGWGKEQRESVLEQFQLDEAEFTPIHQLNFDTYELGKLTLDEYLQRTVFYKKRDFTMADFRKAMLEQSLALPGAIDFFKKIKQEHQLKVFALSNEGRELNEHRIAKFKLNELFDAYVSSCYVNLRKPDAQIYKLAIDITRVKKNEALYVDDRKGLIDVAASLGIPSLHHTTIEQTEQLMNTSGLLLGANATYGR